MNLTDLTNSTMILPLTVTVLLNSALWFEPSEHISKLVFYPMGKTLVTWLNKYFNMQMCQRKRFWLFIMLVEAVITYFSLSLILVVLWRVELVSAQCKHHSFGTCPTYFKVIWCKTTKCHRTDYGTRPQTIFVSYGVETLKEQNF